MQYLPDLNTAIGWAERGWIPDVLVRQGIRNLVRVRLKQIESRTAAEHRRHVQQLAARNGDSPIAVHTAAANEQHYEVPAAFFQEVLGRHLKYSCCWWGEGIDDLDQAEAKMLRITAERAQLKDGDRILELGCGWGSLTLWMAEHFPRSPITAVSNSQSQRRFIEDACRRRGLANVEVITADVSHFEPQGRFDRVVSVEMFEHVRNHRRLLQRIARWLAPDGRLFVHIFCHREAAYPF